MGYTAPTRIPYPIQSAQVELRSERVEAPADDVLLRLRQAAPDGLLEVGAGQQAALERERLELPRGRAVGGGGEDGDQRPWAYTRPLLSST